MSCWMDVVFASFPAEKTSAALIGMIFWKYSKSQWVMALLRHKGTGASFTSEKHKQPPFISVWIMSGTTPRPLVRWDFFRGLKTTNWACFTWFSQMTKRSSLLIYILIQIQNKDILQLSSLWNPSLIAARTGTLAHIIMRGMTINSKAGKET